MSTAEALIDEYNQRGWRERVRAIAGYDWQGQVSPDGYWYQVHDLHMLALHDDEPPEKRCGGPGRGQCTDDWVALVV